MTRGPRLASATRCEVEGAGGGGDRFVAGADELEESADEALLALRVDGHHRPELGAVDLTGVIVLANLLDFVPTQHEIPVPAFLMGDEVGEVVRVASGAPGEQGQVAFGGVGKGEELLVGEKVRQGLIAQFDGGHGAPPEMTV